MRSHAGPLWWSCVYFCSCDMGVQKNSKLRIISTCLCFQMSASSSPLCSGRCLRPSTKRCRTTMCTWRVRCWSPTWSQLDTPAPTSTATRRSPWQPSQPWDARCPPPSPVSHVLRPTGSQFLKLMMRQGWAYSAVLTVCVCVGRPGGSAGRAGTIKALSLLQGPGFDSGP